MDDFFLCARRLVLSDWATDCILQTETLSKYAHENAPDGPIEHLAPCFTMNSP